MRAAKRCGARLVFMALTTLVYAGGVGINTSSLPNGAVGQIYSATIHGGGGCTPYSWSIKSGSLPAGLSAEESPSTRSYIISGIPTTGESSTFTVEVVGCRGYVSTKSFTVAIQSNYSVSLNWDPSSSPDITGYNIYRGTVSGGPYTQIAGHVTSTAYTDTTVADNQTYYYVTTAVNSSNMQSGYSDQVIVNVP